MNNIYFKTVPADSIKVGDLMRQAEEDKRHTDFYHFRATSVFIGDIEFPVFNGDGTFAGNAVDRDVVEIEWTPIELEKSFKRKYFRTAPVEIATTPVEDTTQLITSTEHTEEI
jgi:hypothetical protein